MNLPLKSYRHPPPIHLLHYIYWWHKLPVTLQIACCWCVNTESKFSPCNASARGRRSSWGRRCAGRRSCPVWPDRRRSWAPPPAPWWEAAPRPDRPPSICKESRADARHKSQHAHGGNIHPCWSIQLGSHKRCSSRSVCLIKATRQKLKRIRGSWKQKAVFNNWWRHRPLNI